MIRTLTAAALALALPIAAHAAGGGDSSPPKSTNTTKTCTNGKVWGFPERQMRGAQPERAG